MKPSARNYKRIVIKIGASILCSGNRVDSELVSQVAAQISDLIKEGREVVVVSSGAIALGMSTLGLEARPKSLSSLQAAAAIGQHELMDLYRKALKERGLNCAQILLTWEDFSDRRRYLNAKNTVLALLKIGKVVPIINENDTVSTDEIKFGDNDRLSALVSTLIDADLLIILSDVEGLLERDKKTVIRLVDKITPQIKALACPTTKKACVGGMITKIEAAKIAMDSGIPCIIADGKKKDVILSCVNMCAGAGGTGTLFLPKGELLGAKKRWIAFSAKPGGKIMVDEGAKQALLNKKSLLSVGITACEGSFDSGDIVSLRDRSNCEFARGKVGISSKELEKVKGRRYDKEIIHRDNIVIL